MKRPDRNLLLFYEIFGLGQGMLNQVYRQYECFASVDGRLLQKPPLANIVDIWEVSNINTRRYPVKAVQTGIDHCKP